MTEKTFPRQIFLPPQGRPRWQPRDPAGWELLYLGWGRRWFGDNPIPPAMHEGWVYCAILEGTPRAVINGAARKTGAGHVFIFHPDCAYGWRDQPAASCRMLSWLWRTPPAHSALLPKPGGYKRLTVGEDGLHPLGAIHAACQREVGVPSELAFLGLKRARLDLDICLARALNRKAPADTNYRVNLAIQFLRHNPAELEPVKKLCEYLQVSPSTLKNLFQTHCGQSPQAFALEQRMKLAHARLAAGEASVKEVAYALGYRHPNDFSRAFKRFFGVTAKNCQMSNVQSPMSNVNAPSAFDV